MTYELLEKARHGRSLDPEEIRNFLKDYCEGCIPDYIVSAWLMAVACHGMTPEETTALTLAMRDSGECFDLSALGTTIDKHSTGGVGDKLSLIVAPIVASCGGRVPKMSGRGLGYTGGTIDKLESIPGLCTALSQRKFFEIVDRVGCCIIGQSEHLTPADKKLYALRNLTATVDSIPLIASSIMSKKLAMGASGILLDVKVGCGAFMKTKKEAEQLARSMVEIGKACGKPTRAILTSMEEPLGFCVGNALEIKEAIAFLSNDDDFLSMGFVTEILAENMLMMSGMGNREQCRSMVREALSSGKALETFEKMIEAQGGDPRVIEHPEILPRSREFVTVFADFNGYIENVNAEEIGKVTLLLGAGRRHKHDSIDPGAGIRFYTNHHTRIQKGDRIFTVYGSSLAKCEEAAMRVKKALSVIETEGIVFIDKIPPVSGEIE